MARTFFQDFNLDDGRPVTVEYSYDPGSETAYSPMYGADGGDGCEVEIRACWPNTAAHDDLCRRRNELSWGRSDLCWPVRRVALAYLDLRIWLNERSVRPSSNENHRMEGWLIEHHVYDPYDPEDF